MSLSRQAVESVRDIYSRLLKRQNHFLDGEVNDASASVIVAQFVSWKARSGEKTSTCTSTVRVVL